MEKVIVVVGPTGVGKTKMGVELAKTLDGEIISGDSMQIYKGMDIGTAKVTVEEMQGIKHHCIDILSPFDDYSVKEFQKNVREKISEIASRKKMPIIVGGTGLYIKAVLYDYDFGEEKSSNREEYRLKYEKYSNEELFEILKEIDEKSAQELHPNNRQRVLRAIEIYETTGHTKSDIIDAQEHRSIYDVCYVGLTLDRPILYERINTRVDKMIEQGLKKETEQLIESGLTRDFQSMKGIGYKEWFDFFENKASLNETIELIKQHSRQYAKRQYTWFNNQFEMVWYSVELDDFEKTVSSVLKDINRWIEK